MKLTFIIFLSSFGCILSMERTREQNSVTLRTNSPGTITFTRHSWHYPQAPMPMRFHVPPSSPEHYGYLSRLRTELEQERQLEQTICRREFDQVLNVMAQASHSTKALLSLDSLSFQAPGARSLVVSSYNKHLSIAISHIKHYLYNTQGGINNELDYSRAYKVAQIITHDFIKPSYPDNYKSIVAQLAQSNLPGFERVNQWIKETGGTKQWAGGLFEGTRVALQDCFNSRFEQKIKNNSEIQNLHKINDLCREGEFDKARLIIQFYSDRQKNLNAYNARNLYKECWLDKVISNATDNCPQMHNLLQESVPLRESNKVHYECQKLAEQVIHEISKSDYNNPDSMRLTFLKSGLHTLSKLYENYCKLKTEQSLQNLTAYQEYLTPLLDTFGTIIDESIGTSLSIETLPADMMVSVRSESVSHDELTRNTYGEQQATISQQLSEYYSWLLAPSQEGLSSREFAETQIKLINTIHDLNKANHIEYAKCLLMVGRDVAAIIIHDRPLKEIVSKTAKAITDPISYSKRVVEGLSSLNDILIERVKSNLDPSLEREYQRTLITQERLAEFQHQWQHMPHYRKKELVGQLLSDLLIGKTITHLPGVLKLLDNSSITFSEMGGVGSVAVPIPQAVSYERCALAGASQIVGAASDRMTEVASAQQSLFDFSLTQDPKWKDIIGKHGTITQLNPIDAPNLSGGDVIFVVKPNNPNSIEQFEVTKKMIDHIFSEEHIESDIMKLGIDKNSITRDFIELILKAESEGLLKGADSFQIELFVNSHPLTLRTHIINGKLMFLNGFKAHPNRIIGKLIDWKSC